MKKNEKTIEVLNDLIRINSDRVAGYERAAREEKTLEPDVRNFFYRVAMESRSFVNDLHAEVLRLGGMPVSGSTLSGKIFLFWLDVKTKFREGYTGNDNTSVLASAEAGEEAIQKAYEHVLQAGIDLPENVERLIDNQRFRLGQSAEVIKKYRNERLISH